MSTLVVLGPLDGNWRRAVCAAAEEAALDVRFGESLATPALPETDVSAVVLGGGVESAVRLAEGLRAEARLEKTALLAIDPEVTTAAFVRYLTAGVDDVLPNPGEAGIVQRLKAAREASLGAVRSLRRGMTLCLGGPPVAAAARARALGSAGFRVGIEADGAAPWLSERRLALVVWQPGDAAGALDAVRAARAEGVLCRFVLVVGAEQATDLAGACEKLDGVRVLPETSPPDNVVFLVNEMAETTVQNQRASRRRLAATLVRFRAGVREDVGLSYNVSAGGLYVRTLAPPGAGPVELSVEIGKTQAELSCEVAWSRALSHDGTATAPPGFGVKILEATEDARALLATLG